MAADAAVMVIDAAKGVEAQTIKLFKVCTLRHIPIFTFMNKMDREARDPFELMEEIENDPGHQDLPHELAHRLRQGLQGRVRPQCARVMAFEATAAPTASRRSPRSRPSWATPPGRADRRDNHTRSWWTTSSCSTAPPTSSTWTPCARQAVPGVLRLRSDQLRRGAVPEGVPALAPTPLPRTDALTGELVDPCREQFSGFVFKIQANMNKNHRDRIAFVRICSGKFERGMEAFHVQEGKKLKLATGTSLMADDRAIVDEAYAGDIIGLFDPGIFSIGDTLCTGKKHVQFAGIPTFAPSTSPASRRSTR